MALIGTNRWLEHSIDDPALQGAYIATLDVTETDPIGNRFKAIFNYTADITAAYAYDTAEERVRKSRRVPRIHRRIPLQARRRQRKFDAIPSDPERRGEAGRRVDLG
ncbi:hypothetical protein [Mesorhizobium sp. KR1-2]|uniref:hypothetical protein n=1 Tax=Mesorhizobium sp. KR1-2 TaxID=3156609 RepID=UPI0032B36230